MKLARGMTDVGLLMVAAAMVWLGRNSFLLYWHFNRELDPAIRGYTLPLWFAQPSFYLYPMGLLAIGVLLILIGRFRGAP